MNDARPLLRDSKGKWVIVEYVLYGETFFFPVAKEAIDCICPTNTDGNWKLILRSGNWFTLREQAAVRLIQLL